MFGYLVPKSYKEASEFDKEANRTKWANVIRDEIDCIKELEVFTACQRVSQMGFKPQMYHKCTSQLPEDQGQLDICCQVQWETQDKTCGRWVSHSRHCGEHLLRSSVPETLATLKSKSDQDRQTDSRTET